MRRLAILALALGQACSSPERASPVTETGGTETTTTTSPTTPEPAIVAPDPVPQHPEDDGLGAATSRDGEIEWRLLASDTEISMAERSSWRLRIEATNHGSIAIDPMLHHSQIALDGAPSMTASMAFSNGAMEHGWTSLPPSETVLTERELGESLFASPGDYHLTLTHGSATSTLRIRVTP